MKVILETSGSTGSSKAVVVSDHAFLLQAEVDKVDLDLTPRSILAVDRLATAVLKMYQAKTSGCKLAFYSEREQASLRQWILSEKITHLSTIATTFRWVASGIYKFPSVEVLEIGGEMVDWDDVRLAREAFPNARFVNRYAAVEARVICRKHVKAGESGQGRMPVGKPISGVGVAVVETGEIAVSSPYLSEGYYNDPELTAAKFRDGWYYTGDRGYWLPTDDLQHCGRMDFAQAPQEQTTTEEVHDQHLAKWTLAGG